MMTTKAQMVIFVWNTSFYMKNPFWSSKLGGRGMHKNVADCVEFLNVLSFCLQNYYGTTSLGSYNLD